MTQPWIVRLRSLLIPLTVLSASLGAQFMLMKWSKRASETEWSECPIFNLKKESVRPLTFPFFVWKWVLFPFIVCSGLMVPCSLTIHQQHTNAHSLLLLSSRHCSEAKACFNPFILPLFRLSQLNVHYVYFSWIKMNKGLPYALIDERMKWSGRCKLLLTEKTETREANACPLSFSFKIHDPRRNHGLYWLNAKWKNQRRASKAKKQMSET